MKNSKTTTEEIELLRLNLAGTLLSRDDPEFENARALWNRMIDKRPFLIIKCVNDEDVVKAVHFAREKNLLVSVRGGGHNVAGNAICNDGLVIDLSNMKSIEVDTDSKTARVQAGVLLGELDAETQKFGLALPTGIISETGIAGLTLGGGLGWLGRKYGLTIDNLISAEIVTAKGIKLIASSKENPDLFWALRGGGGNFGIVTTFEFQLHDVGPELFCGLRVYPFENALEIIKYHREFVQELPDELSAWQVVRKAPPLPFIPTEVHGQLVVITAYCHAGEMSKGQRLMAGYNPGVEAHGINEGPTPYAAWQSGFDGLQGNGARNYWKSHNLNTLSDSCIETIVSHMDSIPSGHTEILIPHLQGAISRKGNYETAYGHRQSAFLLNIHGRWEKEEEDSAGMEWVKGLFNAVKPFSNNSVYVNFISEDEEAGRINDAYPAEIREKLEYVKLKYDPENFFRMNQNIKPSLAQVG
jgi:hypothetical protein